MALWSWGSNRCGQLGDSSLEDRLQPVILETLKHTKITKIECGDAHTLAVAGLGDLFAWGRGRDGALGTGQRILANPIPQKVHALERYHVVACAAGCYHSVALTSDGKVFQWGRLYRFDDNVEDRNIAQPQRNQPQPRNVTIGDWKPSMRGAKALEKSLNMFTYGSTNPNRSPGNKDILNKLSNGSGSGSGSGSNGNDNSSSIAEAKPYCQTLPMEVKGELNKRLIEAVDAGYGFTVCVAADGSVFSWGINDRYQLGIGHRVTQVEPVELMVKTEDETEKVTAVACGEQHTLLLTSKGHVYSFGLGVFGQLGHGCMRDEKEPRLIQSLVDEKICSISCGSHHSCAVSEDGSVFIFGNREYMQHGGRTEYEDLRDGQRRTHSEHVECSIPHRMTVLPKPIRSVACGSLFNIAQDTDGGLWSWGWGSSGCIGNGSRRYRLKPTEIVRLEGEKISNIACGAQHVIALNTGNDALFAFDFKSSLSAAHFADCAFLVNGRWIKAHKIMVFARCPRLRAMMVMSQRFSSSDPLSWSHLAKKEPPEGCDLLHIPNVRYATFKALLLFLYTDHVSVPSHFVPELMDLGTRYQLPRLTEMCRRLLKLSDSGPAIHIPESLFRQDLSEMVDDELTSDCVFELNEDSVRIHAHRSVLSARCSYFRTVFTSDFEEAHNKTIVLHEIDVDSFMQILQFLYSGDEKIVREADGDTVVDLLGLADRFLMTEMKQICEEVLEAALCPQNAVMLLEIADMYGVPRLKHSAMCLLESLYPFELELDSEFSDNDNDSAQAIKQQLGYLYLDFPIVARELDHFCASASLCRDGELLELARSFSIKHVQKCKQFKSMQDSEDRANADMGRASVASSRASGKGKGKAQGSVCSFGSGVLFRPRSISFCASSVSS